MLYSKGLHVKIIGKVSYLSLIRNKLNIKLITASLVLLLIAPLYSNSQVYNDPPECFPKFNIVTSESPSPGYYFLSGTYYGIQNTTYCIILDTLGFPVFYQKHPSGKRAMGFTMQKNGELSYFGGYQNSLNRKFVILDSTYNIVNELGAVNGFFTDSHELIIEEDGSYWLLAYDIRMVDMSLIVSGGNPNATVVGCVIQHIDTAQNLLFQWNSWNHMDITDCDTLFVDLTAQSIDYVHANALAFDSDGNILLSGRYLNEITKIDIATGDIIWRWGGNNNQFEFQNENDRFFGQHMIRYNKTSDSYTLFDNGNWHSPPHSRGLEFELDQDLFMAYRVSTFDHDPKIFTSAMGGMQRTDDGKTIVNWSKNNCIFTEYDESNNIVFEIECQDSIIVSYRVTKHDWHTSLFSFVDDEVNFQNIVLGDSATIEIGVINNQEYDVVINGFNIENPSFSMTTVLPVTIEAGQIYDFKLQYKPSELTYSQSVFSLFHSTDTSRIAQQIRVTGTTLVGMDERFSSVISDVIIYPNPVNDKSILRLKNNEPFFHIKVADAEGNTIIDENHAITTEYRLNSENMMSGLYFVRLINSKGVHVGKFLVK